MIDLTQLTQEQRWGLAYATKLHNESLPEDHDPITTADFAANVMRESANHHYRELLRAKKDLAFQIFDSLPVEQQEQFLAQLGVPDILTEE